MLKVFLVILNWNRLPDTLECLDSIKDLNVRGFGLETIVVDNGSTDDSLEKLRKIRNIKLVSNKENLGFAGGNNRGIEFALKAGANYVVVLNNDVILGKDSIWEMVKKAEESSEVGAVSPKIYFAKGFEFKKEKYKDSDLGKVIWYAGGTIDWDNVQGLTAGVDKVDRGEFGKENETDFATGTCMLISKKAVREVGMFDEKYFMYYEDTDLSIRLKKAGYRVIYCPKAKVWHKVAQSSGIGSELNDYFISRNRMLFGMKYARLRTKFALIRESVKLLLNGRKWQKIGIRDYYLGRFKKGSWT